MTEKIKILNLDSFAEAGINDFFEKVFNQFSIELDLLSETIYKDNGEGSVFALIEPAWIGVLNNAVIRAFPEIATLQEFGVYTNQTQPIGRADFLVQLNIENKETVSLLFEAKQHEVTNITNTLSYANEYLDITRKSAEKYITDTPKLISNCNYIVAIVFGWIRNENVMNAAREYMDDENNRNNVHNGDFHSLYYQGNHGIWIYGKVHKVDGVNTV